MPTSAQLYNYVVCDGYLFLRITANNCWIQRNLPASEGGGGGSHDMFDEEEKPVPRRHSHCGYCKTRGEQGAGFRLAIHVIYGVLLYA